MAVIVDAHVHIGVWDHADFLGRGCTLAQAAGEMERAGVGGIGIMPTDRRDNAGLLAEARALAASPGAPRSWMFGWVAPGEQGAGRGGLDWVEANADDLVGIKLHPSLSRVRVTDPGFADALDLAEARGLVVLVHCGRWQEMASYRFAIEEASRRPGARFLLAHAGGDTPPLATAAADRVAELGLENVWFDMSGLREYWVARRNIELLGADRYLMASDYSLAHPLMYIGAVRGMGLAPDDEERVLGGNARALFGDRWIVGS